MVESNFHRSLKVFTLPGSVDNAFVINHDEFVVINYAFRSISFPISETVPLYLLYSFVPFAFSILDGLCFLYHLLVPRERE